MSDAGSPAFCQRGGLVITELYQGIIWRSIPTTLERRRRGALRTDGRPEKKLPDQRKETDIRMLLFPRRPCSTIPHELKKHFGPQYYPASPSPSHKPTSFQKKPHIKPQTPNINPSFPHHQHALPPSPPHRPRSPHRLHQSHTRNPAIRPSSSNASHEPLRASPPSSAIRSFRQERGQQQSQTKLPPRRLLPVRTVLWGICHGSLWGESGRRIVYPAVPECLGLQR